MLIMDEVSPDHWTGTGPVSPDAIRPVARRAHNDHMDATPQWLLALPHGAALIHRVKDRFEYCYWNKGFERAFGPPPATPSSVSPTPPPSPTPVHGKEHDHGNEDKNEDKKAAYHKFDMELLAFHFAGQRGSRFEFERRTEIGPEVFDCTLSLIPNADIADEYILLSTVDRTSDRRMEDSLRRELVSDVLTALPNRIGFGEIVDGLLEQYRASAPQKQPPGHLGVLIIDLARFRRINEALGTMAADELILSVAARLRQCLNQEITLARLGGNEFGICHALHGDVAQLKALGQHIKESFATPIRLSNLEISVDCAIGCALAAIHDADPDELIRQAQTAARTAKQSGRLEIYRAGELGAARQRFFLESHLRDTLDKKALSLVYQPIIDLSTGRVKGLKGDMRD